MALIDRAYVAAALVVALLIVFMPGSGHGAIFFAVACTAIAVYRLGNIVRNASDEHVKAIQGIYDEMKKSGNPST